MKTYLVGIATIAAAIGSTPEASAQDFCDGFMDSAWSLCETWEESQWPDRSECAMATYSSACADRIVEHEPIDGRSWTIYEFSRIYVHFGHYGRLFKML
jgi:hypothetical protein